MRTIKKVEEYFDILDKTTFKKITKEKRSVVHKIGHLHQSVNIFLFNSKNELLIQKRSKDKDICPSLWDLSCAEHLKPNETFEEGAIRGLFEELGIETNKNKLILIQDLHENIIKEKDIIDHELVKTYMFIYDGKIKKDNFEVEEIKFILKDEIEKLDEKIFTPWFIKEWNYLKNK